MDTSDRHSIRRLSLGRRVLLGLLGGLLLLITCVFALRWVPPPTTAFMVRERIVTGPIDHRWVPAERMSPELAIAAVASEDQRFPVHEGFDIAAIKEVLSEQGPPRRGASTISQQVAKNLFLWPGGGWLRKGAEGGLTLLIEGLWPKDRILEVYLNIAEFGPGVFGVEAASQRYFGKPAARVSRAEAALLMTALPAPKRRQVAAPTSGMRARQRHVLRQIDNLGGRTYLMAEGAWPGSQPSS